MGQGGLRQNAQAGRLQWIPTMFDRARIAFEAVTTASALGALALWGWVLATQWPRLLYGSSLCGGDAASLGHCLACYPATALTGVAVIGSIILRRRVLPLSAVGR